MVHIRKSPLEPIEIAGDVAGLARIGWRGLHNPGDEGRWAHLGIPSIVEGPARAPLSIDESPAVRSPFRSQ